MKDISNKINFKNIPKDFINLLFNPKGRIDNIEFLLISMFSGAIFEVIASFFIIKGGLFGITIFIIILLIWIYSHAVISIKRVHDLGKSGWFALIPFYNPIALLFRGKELDNKYGKILDKKVQNKKHFIWFFIFLILLITISNIIPKNNIIEKENNQNNIIEKSDTIETNFQKKYIINNEISINNTNGYYEKEEDVEGYDLTLSTNNGENYIGIKVNYLGEEIVNNVKKTNKKDVLKVLKTELLNINSKKTKGKFSDYEDELIQKKGYNFFVLKYKAILNDNVFYFDSVILYYKKYGISLVLSSNNKEKNDKELNKLIDNLVFEETNKNISKEIKYTSKLIKVEYRDDFVDLKNFEFLNTTGSSLIQGAWYDENNNYLIIKMSNKFYHYCNVYESIWSSFKTAHSFGSFYIHNIKGNFSCIGKDLPKY